MTHESLQMVITTARELIRREHDFFVDTGIDNHEHIPRVKRMADAVAAFLEKESVPSDECVQVRQKLISYARDLFVAAWMQPLDGDADSPPSEKEATEYFDQTLRASV
ncbi:hypothetical protein LDC_1336 [sediment metagenome]|uniref:Uncharacterized protein n=1 Tax=sediment metagenome TaxID=749907 RepID=D9PIH8_9ZZZZ